MTNGENPLAVAEANDGSAVCRNRTEFLLSIVSKLYHLDLALYSHLKRQKQYMDRSARSPTSASCYTYFQFRWESSKDPQIFTGFNASTIYSGIR